MSGIRELPPQVICAMCNIMYDSGQPHECIDYVPQHHQAWMPDGDEWVSWTKPQPKGWSSEYYELPDSARELQDLIEYREMNFSIGNIFKACYRLGHKEGTDRMYDLQKIKWYVEREIQKEKENERRQRS